MRRIITLLFGSCSLGMHAQHPPLPLLLALPLLLLRVKGPLIVASISTGVLEAPSRLLMHNAVVRLLLLRLDPVRPQLVDLLLVRTLFPPRTIVEASPATTIFGNATF